MAFTRAAIDTLMATDTRGENWLKFEAPLREKAVTQAQRLMTLRHQEALTETPSVEGVLIRHDLCVGIQAFKLLTKGRMLADGTLTGPKFIASEDGAQVEGATDDIYDAEALMWLDGTAMPPSQDPEDPGPMNLPYQLKMIQG